MINTHFKNYDYSQTTHYLSADLLEAYGHLATLARLAYEVPTETGAKDVERMNAHINKLRREINARQAHRQ